MPKSAFREVGGFGFLSGWRDFELGIPCDPKDWDGREFRLGRYLAFAWKGKRYEVPAGFCTDGKSIPWWARVRYRVFDQGIRAAVVHDWIYRTATVPISREDADRIFMLAQEADYVTPRVYVPQWVGVVVGGEDKYAPRMEGW